MGYRRSYRLNNATAFASDMRDISLRYYTLNGERKRRGGYDVDLMYTILDDLEEFTNFGHRVDSIPDKSSYISSQRRKDRERRKEQHKGTPSYVEQTLQNRRWAFEWQRMAKKRDYFAMVGVPTFLRDVEDILRFINDRNQNLKISKAIDELAKKDCGDSDINRKNKELASSYRKALEKDFELFKKHQEQEVDKKIDKLRDTRLYKYHSSKGRIGDNRFIGEKGSATFGFVFDGIRTCAKSLNITEKNAVSSTIIKRSQENSLTTKLEKLKQEIERLRGAQSERVDSRSSNRCELNFDELDLLQKMDGDISALIGGIEVLYESLKKKEDKYKKILIRIDAIKTRKDVIGDTLMVLRDNSFNFPNTSEMLKHEAKKCDAYLKKNDAIIRDFNDSIRQIERMISEKRAEIERITPRYREVVLTGVKRKEQTKKEQEARDRRNAETLKAQEKQKEYDEWKKVEKVKDEVESTMHPGEGFFPEQAGLYKGKLSQSLHEHNIPAKPEYLSSTRPSEKVEYHVQPPREDKKLDTEGHERLRKSPHGGYEMTPEYFSSLFAKIERELIATNGSCSYSEVFHKVIEYINRHYGDEIANRKQYEQIKKAHVIANNSRINEELDQIRHSR